MSNISGEGTLNGEIFGVSDVIDYNNLTNRPKINNKVVENEHNGRYYGLTESEIIDWIEYAALSDETKKNGKIYYIRNVGTYEEKTISNVSVASFNDGSPNPIVSLKIDIVPDQEGSGTPAPNNQRPIIGYSAIDVIVSPTLTPEAGTTTTIPLDQTVYGGKFNAITGELLIDIVIIDMGSLTWGYTNGRFYNRRDGMISYTQSEEPDILCDIYATNKYTSQPDLTISSWNAYLYIRDDSFGGNTTSFKQAMDGHKCTYKLETPISAYVAPTEILSLLGVNNIWTNEGTINELIYLSPTGNIENQIRVNDEIFARA